MELISVDEARPLKVLFEKLASRHATYIPNERYLTFVDDKKIELHAREMLVLNRYHPKEVVTMAYFGDSPTRVAYAGMDPKVMKKTLDSLRMPQISENLGEKVFSLFGWHLGEIKEGFVHLEQEVLEGSESKFELVLRRLSHVYSGNAIDDRFYQGLKQL